MASYVPKKIDLTPKRHHGYAVLLFIMGTLFPPLAVAARFGIGKDFWLNVLLTICGYIPGHGHNFYIQNIRNNKNHARTPKWAQRYGLVDTSEIQRKARKSQWATRYNDRLPNSTLDAQPYEEGQAPSIASGDSAEGHQPKSQNQANGDLWRPEDESFYNPENQSATSLSTRWRYPTNFQDTEPESSGSKRGKKKDKKKDRWARTEDAYSLSEERSKRKKSKKKKSKSSLATDDSSRDSTIEFPEDAEGGLYGGRGGQVPETPRDRAPAGTADDVFSHQF